MLFAFIMIFAGLLLLYYGADYLVAGSSRLALSYSVRPLVIGLTVVAFATSMPELLVSLFAAIKGSADIAAGNIIGSNIANIGLILGLAALFAPLVVARATLSRELPMMIGSVLLFYLFCLDGVLNFYNGLILFLCLLLFLGYCLYSARVKEFDPKTPESSVKEAVSNRKKDLFLVLVGVVGLGFGAELMVRGAVDVATRLGVSELVIGLSIVALGTSLPELAASVVSAWKGEMDISLGNIIGSNIFNVLFVMGLCPMIKPIAIAPSILRVEFPVMLAFCVGLFLLVRPRLTLGRIQGSLLLTAYAGFIITLFVKA